MDEQAASVDTLAQQIIEQCRREIGAAWLHIEAAKEILRRGRWLLERWADQSRLHATSESARLNSFARSEAARIGMFVRVEPETPRLRRRRGTIAKRELSTL
jgi:hypothetical protein